ncbi:MAG TPA: 4-carboxymuconolactone decarboxylase [Marmoricola sp.]|nr:4-carboxymuconolactone decarboxylase [Marmoricola sp.]
MTVPTLAPTLLVENPRLPLLVVGPSLGTTTALWEPVAALLGDRFEVLGFDLPGHGRSPTATAAYDVAELASAVAGLVAERQAARGDSGATVLYAGDSLGGVIGLQLLLDVPWLVRAAVVLASAARIGEPSGWQERATLVRSEGTKAVVDGSRQRWFATGFPERRPDVTEPLLATLADVDDESYALACEALAAFDVRDRLDRIGVPVLVVSGTDDPVAPPELGAAVAAGVRRGRAEVLAGIGHLPPAEDPLLLADLLGRFLLDHVTVRETYDAGLAVRRSVLGDAHVDQATAAIDDTTRDFQELITRYAWGTIWTRPGLDRRSRSMITLTALVAHAHWHELAMHVRAALTNGLSREEIVEVLLQSAIYCSVPSANSAFRVAQQVFDEIDSTTTDEGNS